MNVPSYRGRIRPVRPDTRAKSREQAPDLLDLVLVDPVSHPWIDPFGNRTAERLEHASGLVHPIERNMRIGVAATEENRGAGELAGVVTRPAFRPDQTTAQTDHRAIAAR